LAKDQLRILANSDRNEVIREVVEFYGDYYPINNDLVTLNLNNTRCLFQESFSLDAYAQVFGRTVDGVSSLLYSLRTKPVVRYLASSKACRNVAQAVFKNLEISSEIYEGPANEPDSVLVLMDRREDPVTPLLCQWTYQAMIHEFFGLSNNKVDMTSVYAKAGKQEKPENSIFVLSPEQDQFYKTSMFMNFGELGKSVKELVEVYDQRVKSNKKLDTLEDMRNFIDGYADFVVESGTVSKHVALLTEVNNQIDERELMKVGALEQSLACENDHNTAISEVKDLLSLAKISFLDKLKLVMLYALRYETFGGNELSSLKDLLRHVALNESDRSKVEMIDELLKFAGSKVRSGDLFNTKDWISAVSSNFKTVSNIFTQHQPYIARVIDRIVKQSSSKALDVDFPCVEAPVYKTYSLSFLCDSHSFSRNPKTIILFIIGGVTFEEAAYVSNLNASNAGFSVILGGTSILNSTM
jgi:vacuolar protein sorting-associated protein 45